MNRKNITTDKINDESIKNIIQSTQKLINDINNSPCPFECMLEEMYYVRKIATLNGYIRNMESKFDEYRISILYNFSINGFTNFYIYVMYKRMDSIQPVVDKIKSYIAEEDNKIDRILTLNSALDEKSNLLKRYNDYIALLHDLKDKCLSLKNEVYFLLGERISEINNKISNEEISLPIRPKIEDVICFLESIIYLCNTKNYQINNKIKVISIVSSIKNQIQNHLEFNQSDNTQFNKAMHLLNEVEIRLCSQV